METLTRCNNGHYYDAQKHTSCPFCGVQSLDIEIKKTMAKKTNAGENASREEPAASQEPDTRDRPAASGPAASRDSGGDSAKTVGIFRKHLGLELVVGWVVAIEGPEKGSDYRITPEKNFIGRAEGMDIRIAGDESISRENHAVISYNPKNNTFRVYPGGSRGLVYLNDEELITPEILKSHDIIQLGGTKLLFVPLCGEDFRWSK